MSNLSSTQAQALPVVSNMDDHAQMNSDLGTNLPLAESTDATIEMMQEPEFSADAGMNPDTMVDELGSVLSKYEVPMGLMNKVSVLRSTYDIIIDFAYRTSCALKHPPYIYIYIIYILFYIRIAHVPV
jgi:hypothetical protein